MPLPNRTGIVITSLPHSRERVVTMLKTRSDLNQCKRAAEWLGAGPGSEQCVWWGAGERGRWLAKRAKADTASLKTSVGFEQWCCDCDILLTIDWNCCNIS